MRRNRQESLEASPSYAAWYTKHRELRGELERWQAWREETEAAAETALDNGWENSPGYAAWLERARTENGHVYIARCAFHDNYYKIGATLKDDPRERVQEWNDEHLSLWIQRNAMRFTYLDHATLCGPANLEEDLHLLFGEHKLFGTRDIFVLPGHKAAAVAHMFRRADSSRFGSSDSWSNGWDRGAEATQESMQAEFDEERSQIYQDAFHFWEVSAYDEANPDALEEELGFDPDDKHGLNGQEP